MTLLKKRILVIDDDLAVRESIKKVLNTTGYEVMTAADGQEAAERFAPGRVDLVVLDLNLPARSGWDVFEALTTQHPSVPIIIVTGMPNQYPTAVAAGVGALIEKPIEVATLLKTMEALLAEPEEARLRRLCGYPENTVYVRTRQGDGKTRALPTRRPPRRERTASGGSRR